MDSNNQANEPCSEEAFAELFSKASPRVSPPEIVAAEIRQAIHAEWQKVARQHSRRRNTVSLALAASVLLAVFATFNILRAPLVEFNSQQLATIDHRFGNVTIVPRGESSTNQVTAIAGNDVIETGSDSGLALGWHGGGSLRLDQNTVVVFEAVDQVYLRQGRIYFDSVNNSAQPPQADIKDFLIRTDGGLVQHLGTQYMTEVTAHGFTVSVREGRVSVASDTGDRHALAGEQLSITGSGVMSVTDITGFGKQWQWIEKTTPAIDLHGRLVSEALNWVSRETGLTVIFESTAAENLAVSTELRGLQGQLNMKPRRALEIFMLTVDLDARIDGGNIVVSEAL